MIMPLELALSPVVASSNTFGSREQREAQVMTPFVVKSAPGLRKARRKFYPSFYGTSLLPLCAPRRRLLIQGHIPVLSKPSSSEY